MPSKSTSYSTEQICGALAIRQQWALHCGESWLTDRYGEAGLPDLLLDSFSWLSDMEAARALCRQMAWYERGQKERAQAQPKLDFTECPAQWSREEQMEAERAYYAGRNEGVHGG